VRKLKRNLNQEKRTTGALKGDKTGGWAAGAPKKGKEERGERKRSKGVARVQRRGMDAGKGGEGNPRISRTARNTQRRKGKIYDRKRNKLRIRQLH